MCARSFLRGPPAPFIVPLLELVNSGQAISRQCAKLEQQIILSTNDDEKEQLRQRMVDIQDELQKRHDLELSAADVRVDYDLGYWIFLLL